MLFQPQCCPQFQQTHLIRVGCENLACTLRCCHTNVSDFNYEALARTLLGGYVPWITPWKSKRLRIWLTAVLIGRADPYGLSRTPLLRHHRLQPASVKRVEPTDLVESLSAISMLQLRCECSFLGDFKPHQGTPLRQQLLHLQCSGISLCQWEKNIYICMWFQRPI